MMVASGGRRPSVVHRQHFQSTSALKLMNSCDAFRQREKKVYIFDSCHMTNMAVMSI